MNPAFPRLFLPISDNPNVSCDAGVIEHSFRKRYNALEPIVLNDPFADVAFTASSPSREKGRPIEDDRKPRSMFTFLRFYRFKLAYHVLKKQQSAVVDAWHAGTKSASKTQFFVLLKNLLLLFFPINPERRVGKKVVERFILELITLFRIVR